MSGFDLVEPTSLSEAIKLLDTDDPTVRPFSGGTALILMKKTGVFQPSRLVSLRSIGGRFSEIRATAEGGLSIGALATLTFVEYSAEVARIAPVISSAIKRLSNVRVRNVARVGGNLAHGDPHMDLPPVLSALGAEVAIAGPSGQRRIAVEDLFAGYYETVLTQGEILTEVIIPAQAGWSSRYLKCTTRSADDWPALGVAVSVQVEGGAIRDARVMVSAATEKLTRLSGAEDALRGHAAHAATLSRAAEAAAAETETIGDARGSAAYKTQLLRVYVRRALEQASGAVQ